MQAPVYPAPVYTETDPAVAAEIMRRYSFACLTMMTDDGLKATHLPLMHRAEDGPHGVIYGHLSSYNPQAASFDGAHDGMAVFSGPHAYVSPMWLREPAREVPTWDFVSVHASGRPVALPAAENARLIGDLVDVLEGPAGWRFADMKPSYRDKLLSRVTAFRMPVTSMLCVRKMHQGAAIEDRRLIAAQLRAAGDAAAAEAIEAVGE